MPPQPNAYCLGIHVFRHHAEYDVESSLENIHLQRLVDTVHVEHAGGDAAALEAFAGEDVGIAAAAADDKAGVIPSFSMAYRFSL